MPVTSSEFINWTCLLEVFSQDILITGKSRNAVTDVGME